MRRYHFKSKIIALCVALGLSATAHAEGYTLLPSGAHFQVGEGMMRVEFVTPDIVRVRYTLEPDFLGNGTIVCVGRREGEVLPFREGIWQEPAWVPAREELRAEQKARLHGIPPQEDEAGE